MFIDDIQNADAWPSNAVEDETNSFCNPTASVLVAASQCRDICHHMHGEHTSRSTRLLQTSCSLDYYGGKFRFCAMLEDEFGSGTLSVKSRSTPAVSPSDER